MIFGVSHLLTCVHSLCDDIRCHLATASHDVSPYCAWGKNTDKEGSMRERRQHSGIFIFNTTMLVYNKIKVLETRSIYTVRHVALLITHWLNYRTLYFQSLYNVLTIIFSDIRSKYYGNSKNLHGILAYFEEGKRPDHKHV